ncbi:rRNA methyltransferase [bacterium]|nr:rRNA methyltransferase [bacterium]
MQEVKFAPRTVLIVGNEQKGISKILLDNSDFRVKIATSGKTQSLNAAIATGILLYAKSYQTE